MESVKIVTTKGFLNGSEYVRRGSEIEVSEMRARELQANGLVSRKMAAEPQNKMAEKTANKSKGK